MPNNVIHGKSIDAMSGGSSIDAMSPLPVSPMSPDQNPKEDDDALDDLIAALPGSPDTIVSNAELEKKENEGNETGDESEEEKPFEKTIHLPFEYQLYIK